MIDYKQEILDKSIDYLKKAIPDFKYEKKGRAKAIFSCGLCNNSMPSCSLKPYSNSKMYCASCKQSFDILDIFRTLNSDKEGFNDTKILYEIQKIIGLDIVAPIEIDKLLDMYENNGFDLLPIASGQKIPIEKDWTNKVHKDKKEWREWINKDGLNIGVKCGKSSNITVIDFDSSMPEEIRGDLGNGLIQKTPKGKHYFFKYDKDLPNAVRIGKTKEEKEILKIDIRNENSQIVLSPSITENSNREFLDINKPITKIPDKFKKFLLDKSSKIAEKQNQEEIEIKKDIESENFNIAVMTEGSGRNDLLTRLGGIFSKSMPMSKVSNILWTLNKTLFSPNLTYQEMKNMLGSLNKYRKVDELELAKTIYEYLKIPQEAIMHDIREFLDISKKGKDKENLEKALKYLIKEGLIYKHGKMYHIVESPNWQTEFMREGQEIKFKLPYFHTLSVTRERDMTIIGSSTGFGKTHLAMNIIKRLKDQNIIADYFSSEGGSRFAMISKHLGLVEGDYRYCKEINALNVRLTENKVTIIDWLRPTEYSRTDEIFEKLNSELQKKGGILIVFMQLRNTNKEFFAPDMVSFYPSLVVKFLHKPDTGGLESYFETQKIREVRIRGASQQQVIDCKFNYDTKELQTLTELENVGKL